MGRLARFIRFYTDEDENPPLPPAAWDTASGNPVSFEALRQWPLRQLSVAFSPVQSLNGYDSPWPAGGGANKWDEEWLVGYISNADGVIHESSGQTRIVSKNKIPVQPSTEYYIAGTASVTVYGYAEDESYVSSLTVSSRKFTTPANVYYVCFETSSAYGNTYNHDIAINYPSSVTTYSPYSNICPISGWSSLTVEQTNANLAFVDADHVVVYAGSGTVSDGVVSSDGGADRIGVVFSVTPNTEYSLTFTRTAGGTSYYYIYEYSGWPTTVTTDRIRTIKGETGQNSNGKIDKGFTTGAGAKYVAIVFYKSYSALDYSYDDICLKLGANNYDVVDHTGRSISISLGQTVYSGYVDVISGVGEITWEAKDMGSIAWYYWSGAPVAHTLTADITGRKKGAYNFMCSSYGVLSSGGYNQLESGKIVGGSQVASVYVCDDRFSDSPSFKTAVAGQYICYELATPLTIQLTPQEVSSLLGENNMWSDANGNLTVEFRSN